MKRCPGRGRPIWGAPHQDGNCRSQCPADDLQVFKYESPRDPGKANPVNSDLDRGCTLGITATTPNGSKWLRGGHGVTLVFKFQCATGETARNRSLRLPKALLQEKDNFVESQARTDSTRKEPGKTKGTQINTVNMYQEERARENNTEGHN